jgi:hypothetical protein
MQGGTGTWLGVFFFIVGLLFVYRSFYGMRIRSGGEEAPARVAKPAGAR